MGGARRPRTTRDPDGGFFHSAEDAHARMEPAITHTTTPPSLEGAIAALVAGGSGFSGRDARLAQRLGTIPEAAWSPAEQRAAWELAQRHRFEMLAGHRLDARRL